VWKRVLLVAAVLAFTLAPSGAEAGIRPFAAEAPQKTVCTITVNSEDEKETYRKRLPPGRYKFVELVAKGRAEWLKGSCQKGIQCDVLIVSGHFNAGDDFYSDRLENDEYLRVDELERASCSDSCPGLFSRLKEVYLFGCESLNPNGTLNASHGESSRERMRRIFSGVPVIYGFSSSAPVGPTAAMLLNRYFDGGGSDFASGRADSRLLKIFARNSMTHTSGVRESPAETAYRGQICQLFDDRLSAGQKLAAIHRMLQGDKADARAVLDRIEKLMAGLSAEERSSPEFVKAMDAIAADTRTRDQVLATARATAQPAMRTRLVALAGTLGWLDARQQAAEHARMVSDLLARNAMGFAEVGLVCSLNADGTLEAEMQRVALSSSRAGAVSRAAALACMGSGEARRQVLGALASADVGEVQIAQAYLRHRPVADREELRALAGNVARMPSSAAQVRALDALARLQISDREILDELAGSFKEAKSVKVQRAIAEIFIRSGYRRPELAQVFRRHRLPSGDGKDLIDVLISRLEG